VRITSFARQARGQRRIGTPAADYRLPAALSLVLWAALFAWFPYDWLHGRLQAVGHRYRAVETAPPANEGIALLDLQSSEPGMLLPPRRLPALLPTTGGEAEVEQIAPTVEKGWDWSYDPLVPLRAGTPEPALRGARLADERLRGSLSLREAFSAAGYDTTRWRALHFSRLQREIYLSQRPAWTLEARQIWLDRHELWLKLYGDDDEWP